VVTEERRTGRDPVVSGIMVMSVFGTGWALVGVGGLVSSVPLRVVGWVVALALAALVVRTALRWHASPDPARIRPRAQPPGDPGRTFLLVNVAQAVLILLAVLGLTRLGRPEYIAPAVCLVVGLHFLPLARAFAVPLYWTTGLALVAVAVLGAVLAAVGVGTGAVFAVVGLCAALTLWATALQLARTVV
jgi:hypothetical protein